MIYYCFYHTVKQVMGGDEYKTVAKKRRNNTKRKFQGNRWSKDREKTTTENGDTTGVDIAGVDESSTNDNVVDTEEALNISSATEKEADTANTSSSSANKINLSYYEEHGGESSATNTTNITVENTS